MAANCLLTPHDHAVSLSSVHQNKPTLSGTSPLLVKLCLGMHSVLSKVKYALGETFACETETYLTVKLA